MRAIYAPIRKNHDVCAGGNGTIAGGAELLALPLETVMQLSIEGMTEAAEALGLAGEN